MHPHKTLKFLAAPLAPRAFVIHHQSYNFLSNSECSPSFISQDLLAYSSKLTSTSKLKLSSRKKMQIYYIHEQLRIWNIKVFISLLSVWLVKSWLHTIHLKHFSMSLMFLISSKNLTNCTYFHWATIYTLHFIVVC